MTIFEQTIDTSQVQMMSSPYGIFVTVFIAFLLAFFGFFLVVIGDRARDENVSTISFASQIFLILITSFVTIISVATYFPTFKETTQPVYGESRDYNVKNHDKKSITDTYHEDIDKAVEDKLKDYKIVDTSAEDGINPQESVLNGGYGVRDITAVHDGETYTLTPHWDYDADTSKVTLSVDIKEDS